MKLPAVRPPLPTPAERTAAGKAARTRAPRSSHGEWTPGPDRRDPVAILEDQAPSRVPSLVPIRYARMAETPFTFFRGAAAVMAADLAQTPNAGQTVQVCGDAHLSNFGMFSSPERDLLFDLNDFDETLPGPWEWDVKRLVASGMIAARVNGFSVADQEEAVRSAVVSYRGAMLEFAGMSNLDVWYARLAVDELIAQLRAGNEGDARAVSSLERSATKARRKTSLRAFTKLACEQDGKLLIRSQPPLIVPVEDIPDPHGVESEHRRLAAVVETYRASLPDDRCHLLKDYRYADAAHKVVGVGSVGTRCWAILLSGRDHTDPLFLQAKEAQASVLEPYLGASAYANHGRRVVEGQRLMQAASDSMLGWMSIVGTDGRERDFYMRQLWDGKGSADIDTMDAPVLAGYMGLCGWTLARAHARSGDRLAIAGYLGRGTVFDDAIVRYATTYADQNEHDHAALQSAIATGRVTAAAPGS